MMMFSPCFECQPACYVFWHCLQGIAWVMQGVLWSKVWLFESRCCALVKVGMFAVPAFCATCG